MHSVPLHDDFAGCMTDAPALTLFHHIRGNQLIKQVSSVLAFRLTSCLLRRLAPGQLEVELATAFFTATEGCVSKESARALATKLMCCTLYGALYAKDCRRTVVLESTLAVLSYSRSHA